MAIVEESEYQGNKMIVLKDRPDSKYPFNFGQKKAQLIIECFDQIRVFATTGVINAGDGSVATSPPETEAPPL